MSQLQGPPASDDHSMHWQFFTSIKRFFNGNFIILVNNNTMKVRNGFQVHFESVKNGKYESSLLDYGWTPVNLSPVQL